MLIFNKFQPFLSLSKRNQTLASRIHERLSDWQAFKRRVFKNLHSVFPQGRSYCLLTVSSSFFTSISLVQDLFSTFLTTMATVQSSLKSFFRSKKRSRKKADSKNSGAFSDVTWQTGRETRMGIPTLRFGQRWNNYAKRNDGDCRSDFFNGWRK